MSEETKGQRIEMCLEVVRLISGDANLRIGFPGLSGQRSSPLYHVGSTGACAHLEKRH